MAYKSVLKLLTVAILLSNTCLAIPIPTQASQRCFKMGIPAYAYPHTPNDFWSNSGPVKAGSIYVLNPASGPGAKADPLYTTVVKQVKQAGIIVFGYVDTDYGRRPANTVIADADKFKRLYPAITGIFLDQTQLDSSHLPYYTSLSRSIRTKKLSLAFNPGQPIIDEHYMPLADHIMTFEGPLPTYVKTTFPQWQSKYPSHKFWHLIYDVPTSTAMRQVIARADKLPVKLLYITNRHMPNPWDAVPPYWNDEIKAFCHSKPSQ